MKNVHGAELWSSKKYLFLFIVFIFVTLNAKIEADVKAWAFSLVKLKHTDFKKVNCSSQWLLTVSVFGMERYTDLRKFPPENCFTFNIHVLTI